MKDKGHYDMAQMMKWHSIYDMAQKKLLETITEDFHKEIVQICKVMVKFAFNLKLTIKKHPARDLMIKDQFRKGQMKKVKFRKSW